MSRVCRTCGKKPSKGNRVARRGLPKCKGGIGLKTTGIRKRVYKPNLQRIRAVVNGAPTRLWVCTSCIKAGKVQKPTARVIPETVASAD